MRMADKQSPEFDPLMLGEHIATIGGPGFEYREANYSGSAERGFGPGTYGAIGQAKGNRGWNDLRPRIATTDPRGPIGNLKAGK